jgi:hypothetical protein
VSGSEPGRSVSSSVAWFCQEGCSRWTATLPPDVLPALMVGGRSSLSGKLQVSQWLPLLSISSQPPHVGQVRLRSSTLTLEGWVFAGSVASTEGVEAGERRRILPWQSWNRVEECRRGREPEERGRAPLRKRDAAAACEKHTGVAPLWGCGVFGGAHNWHCALTTGVLRSKLVLLFLVVLRTGIVIARGKSAPALDRWRCGFSAHARADDMCFLFSARTTSRLARRCGAQLL